jgi:hypothetical protein
MAILNSMNVNGIKLTLSPTKVGSFLANFSIKKRKQIRLPFQ